ncbi:MAG: RNA methyltransferase [Chloroflexota bacterium]|nr:MAG: RNA methyltransferase [Chloroflexota bacterium]
MKKLKNSELDRISVEEFKKSKKIPITILLENIRSAHNIGSVFRTADSFLINEIILCGISAQPPNKDIRKTALGSSESVEWKYEKNIEVAIQKLKDEGNKIISIEQTTNSISLENFKPSNNSKYAIIFGNEVNGIEQRTIDLSDMAIEIPQYGTKHSLNISVAAGIIIWNIFSKINHE